MRTTLVKFVARVCGLSLAAVLLACPSNSAQAQTQTDDPAARAMARIRATVDERAAAAERALAAALAAVGLVNKGVEARKQGKSDEARAALRQAELMIIASAPAERGLITEELLRRIAAEQAALNPTAPAPGAKRGWPGLTSTRAAPRIALARYNSYRDILTRILIEEKLPLEVLSVALVESGFNPLGSLPATITALTRSMRRARRRATCETFTRCSVIGSLRSRLTTQVRAACSAQLSGPARITSKSWRGANCCRLKLATTCQPCSRLGHK